MKQSILRKIARSPSWFYGVGSAVSIVVLTVLLQELGFFQAIDKVALAQCFRLRRTQDVSAPITLVTLSEGDLKELKQWPLDDAELSRLLSNIQQEKPSVIGLNVYRDMPVGLGYEALLQTLASKPTIIGIEKIVPDDSEQSVAALPLLKERSQVAASDVVVDDDGVLRRHLLSLYDDDGQLIFSLGLRLALEHLARLSIEPQVLDAEQSQLRLGQATLRPLDNSEGGYVRVDAGGYQILSNFYYRKPAQLTQVSWSEVLAGTVPPELFRDRIVLVGIMAPSLQSRFHTAHSFGSDETWYGVELQADLAAQIIAAATQGRPPLRGEPRWMSWVSILLASGVGTLVVWLSGQPKGRGWLSWELSLTGGMLLWLGAGYSFFLAGWWVSVAAPVGALWGSGWFGQRLRLWQELQRSRHQLSHYSKRLARRNRVLENQTQAAQALQLEIISLSAARAEAEQASRSKSEFIAEMGHELRNPLNAILGFSEAAESDEQLPLPYRKSLSIIHNSSKHLLSLVNSLLDFANVGTQPTRVNHRQVNLRSLVQNIEDLLQPQASEKRLKLDCRVDDQLPEVLWLDDTKLRQVLINLLSNAIKFTRHGHVLLRVWCEPQASQLRAPSDPQVNPSWLVHFAVEDTGPGISAAQQKQIFSLRNASPSLSFPLSYFSATVDDSASTPEPTSLKEPPGLGLGLPISRNLIQLMGGELQLTSRLGKGTRFYFALSLETAPPLSQSQGQLSIPSTQYRLLIVDDSAVNRKLLVRLVQDLALDVKEAANGEAAIALWRSWKPDLILMDLQMPVMDGYDATRQIRQLEIISAEQETSATDVKTPIIAVTGNTTPAALQAAVQAGCDMVLSKPFQRSEVLSRIMDALSPTL